MGFILVTFWQADGKADSFYLRFTTPKQHSLILGTSRAAQGLIPHVIDSVTGEIGMFNYAMTIVHSPYGKVYFESIKKKLDAAGTDGVFILEVGPWNISNPNEKRFWEASTFVSKLRCVDCKPNIEYLMRFYPYQYLHLWRTGKLLIELHEDGWLDVEITMDPSFVEKRTKDKIDHYKTVMLPAAHYSETRFGYLQKTIALLQNHGRVFLVRLPVYPEMYDLENILMPDFDAKMEALCADGKAQYFNYGADGAEYRFTDGNHLWKGSSEKFSRVLGSRIQSAEMQDDK